MKNILENLKELDDVRLAAAEFIEGLGISSDNLQASSEESMHAINRMTFRDAGIDREGEIGRHRGLKARVAQGDYDTQVVVAVVVRSLCRDVMAQSIKSAQQTNRQKKQRTVQ